MIYPKNNEKSSYLAAPFSRLPPPAMYIHIKENPSKSAVFARFPTGSHMLLHTPFPYRVIWGLDSYCVYNSKVFNSRFCVKEGAAVCVGLHRREVTQAPGPLCSGSRAYFITNTMTTAARTSIAADSHKGLSTQSQLHEMQPVSFKPMNSSVSASKKPRLTVFTSLCSPIYLCPPSHQSIKAGEVVHHLRDWLLVVWLVVSAPRAKLQLGLEGLAPALSVHDRADLRRKGIDKVFNRPAFLDMLFKLDFCFHFDFQISFFEFRFRILLANPCSQ